MSALLGSHEFFGNPPEEEQKTCYPEDAISPLNEPIVCEREVQGVAKVHLSRDGAEHEQTDCEKEQWHS
jgi:hypothetical protein